MLGEVLYTYNTPIVPHNTNQTILTSVQLFKSFFFFQKISKTWLKLNVCGLVSGSPGSHPVWVINGTPVLQFTSQHGQGQSPQLWGPCTVVVQCWWQCQGGCGGGNSHLWVIICYCNPHHNNHPYKHDKQGPPPPSPPPPSLLQEF